MTALTKRKLPVKIAVGDVFETTDSGEVEVVHYLDWKNIYIQYKRTGFIGVVNSSNLRRGAVKDPFQPTVYGVGIAGNSPYKKISVGYTAWGDMLKRCYVLEHKGYSRYGGRGVTVVDDWLYYDNFKLWWDEHYKGGNICLDKDILVQNCKEYSPANCCLLPEDLNKIVLTCNSRRGDYPVGVSKMKNTSFFRMRINDKRRGDIDISGYLDPWAAFEEYKDIKLENIKYAANLELSKGTISQEVHDALLRYEIVPFPE